MTYRVKRYGRNNFALTLSDGCREYFTYRTGGDFYVSRGEKIWREAGLKKLAALGMFEFGSGRRGPTVSEVLTGRTTARAA